MTTARILTVRQPWAWAIIHGGKNVENRVRNIAGDYRGPVLIHAALAVDEAADQAIHSDRRFRSLSDALAATNKWKREAADPYLARGAIIGVVDLVGVHEDECAACYSCSEWADRGWHLILKNPRALEEPIPYRGALGLRKTEFDVVGDHLAAPWGHPKGQVCTPMGCEPGCYLEPVGRLVATS